MKIEVAKSAGFCFGVKRAVEQVYEQIEANNTAIYTFGPIIHNDTVVNDLEKKGVIVIETKKELENVTQGTIVIRSHGVSKDIYELIERKKLNCVDATCPFVKRIHQIVEKESDLGNQIIIIGNPGHPEVEGIKGWSSTPTYVIEREEEIDKLKSQKGQKFCVVSQTTFNNNKFQELVEIFRKKGNMVMVVNTI